MLNNKSPIAWRILSEVALHIRDSEIWSDDEYPVGGMHVKPRPLECKVDAIEVNMLFIGDFEESIRGVVNVNVFHTDLFRIATLSRVVELIMEDALINGFYFRKEIYRVFANGRYLRYNNMRYEIEMDAQAFYTEYGDQ